MSKPPQVPAVITDEVVTRAPTSAVAALPPLEVLDDLTKELDAIVAMDGRAFKQFERLDAMRVPTREAIEAAKATLAGLPRLAERAEAADGKCRDLFPDEDRYDEDAGFRNKIIGSRVGLIVAAYPSSKDSASGAAFGAMLVDEFKAARPSLRALETTGPAIRRTLKFKPSIAEALGELKAQESKWDERQSVATIDLTQELLEEAIPKAEERLAQEEERKREWHAQNDEFLAREEERRKLAAEQEAARRERLRVIFERVEREAREREEARRAEDQRRRAEEWEWLTEEERQRRRDEEGMFG